jgi:ribonuclease VapC
MKRYVFDSYAILAFLEDESGADKVEEALRDVISGNAEAYVSIINWGEIYYITMREQGREVAEEVIEHLDRYPFSLVEASRELTKEAARFKGRFRVAYADCFAAALACQYNATVLTGDPEFKFLENEVEVSWLP